MAFEMVGGALLGVVAGELLKQVVEMKDQLINFKLELERLESTLHRVMPRIKMIKQLDGDLADRRREDMDRLIFQLEEGKQLLSECTKLRKRDFHKKVKYLKKLMELENRLLVFFQLDVQAEIWRETMQLGVDMQEAHMKLDDAGRKLKVLAKGMAIGGAVLAVGTVAVLAVAIKAARNNKKVDLDEDE